MVYTLLSLALPSLAVALVATVVFVIYESRTDDVPPSVDALSPPQPHDLSLGAMLDQLRSTTDEDPVGHDPRWEGRAGHTDDVPGMLVGCGFRRRPVLSGASSLGAAPLSTASRA